MIPSKSIHKYRLNKGGYIENPQLFSLLSSCLLKIKPDPSIISLKPAKLLRFCLILQTIDYSLEDDPDFNYAVNLIEFHRNNDVSKIVFMYLSINNAALLIIIGMFTFESFANILSGRTTIDSQSLFNSNHPRI